MHLRELLAAIESMGLDLDTEVVISTPTACYTEFELELCDHEHENGGVINGPDPGWGGPEHDPRPLTQPVLSIDVMRSEVRGPTMF